MSGKKTGKKRKTGKARKGESDMGRGVNWWDTNSLNSGHFSTDVKYESPEKVATKKKTGKAKTAKNANSKAPSKSRMSPVNNWDDDKSNVNEPEKKEEKSEDVPLINLERKSPPIWTFGSLIAFLIVLACEIVQNSGFASMAKNPMFGPTEEVMILMGAKEGRKMLAGEWWRFFTAMFVHSGLIHFVIIAIFTVFIRSVEIETGFWRAFFVYLISSIFGYILSALLIPEMVSCGATGGIFGCLGLRLVDVISSWRSSTHSGRDLGIIIICIVVGIIIGLTPFLDNFLNLGGFVMGILFALMLVPNLTFGKCERLCHGLISFIAFPIMSIIFCICFVLFYRRIDGSTWCTWCNKITCVNINNWCPNYTTTSEAEFYIT